MVRLPFRHHRRRVRESRLYDDKPALIQSRMLGPLYRPGSASYVTGPTNPHEPDTLRLEVGTREAVRARLEQHNRELAAARLAEAAKPTPLARLSARVSTLLVEPNGELFVIDHGSTNGTYVGQERVTANQKHHVPRGSALSFSQHIRLRVVQPWRAKVQGRTT